jgi:hypothetical protein
MDIKELKARAYDLISAMEKIQNELGQVNKLIAQEANKPKEVKDENSDKGNEPSK